MSAQTTASKVVTADSGLVADVIGDVESYPTWTPQFKRVRILSTDEADWPVQVEFEVDAGPVQDTYVLEYTWDLSEDGQGVVSWHLVRSKALKAMDGSYTLTSVPGGTEVTYALAVDTAMPLPSMMKRKAEKSIVEGALDGLQRRCAQG